MINKEGWIRAVWQFLVWFAGKFMDFAHFCLDKLLAENVVFEFDKALFIVLFSTLLIGSGCWAASIAISRRHSGPLHFVLGAMFPLIYPFIIMFCMELHGEGSRRRKLEEEKRQKELAEEEKQRVLEIQGLREKKEEGQSSEDKQQPSFNKSYFEDIARDESGQKAGPWKVGFGGNDIVVQQILEVQDSLLLVELSGREGKNEKLRIPFNRIDYWKE
ncbi:MAG: hypothetical protein PHG44_00775 [Lentisphaeria bacterium]|jgi:hypothetical protein|nr:hypothetical protein [Lentisphaeria bacterium]MDY0176123.1 hypothetical protein [Lentisphaeria bacterium]NLZ60449.1 hypothetical protein [Lentisphaerota bacterium]